MDLPARERLWFVYLHMKLDGEQVQDRDIMRWVWMLILRSTFDYPCAIDGVHIIESSDGAGFMDMVQRDFLDFLGIFLKLHRPRTRARCRIGDMRQVVCFGVAFAGQGRRARERGKSGYMLVHMHAHLHAHLGPA